MSLDIQQFGGDIASSFTDAAKEMYADAEDKWAIDEAFFQEIATDYKECATTLLHAKVSGDEALQKEMAGNLRQLTATIAARVETRHLQLDAAVKVQLSGILTGIGKAVGSILGGAILAAL